MVRPADTARPRGVKAEDAFRTISEVADHLGLAQHVLRFWESKFSQLRPLKRGGNRRYYRPSDIKLLEVLQILLHREGYTIRGVQKLFKEQGLKDTIEAALASKPVEPVPVIEPSHERVSIEPSAEFVSFSAEAKKVQEDQATITKEAQSLTQTAEEIKSSNTSIVDEEKRASRKAKQKAALADILGELKVLRENIGDLVD